MARKPALIPPSAALLAKAVEVHRRLCVTYHCPIAYFHSLDPLSELVSSLLSHRTRNADSGRAFKTLRERFPTWQHVIDAATADVQDAIAACTWPELKAPRIQQILRLIQVERGELSLDFLADFDVPAARAWLERLPGVGKKTSAAVLSFSVLRKPALPVDSHHHRVAERLELIPAKTTLERAHELLEAQLPPGASAQHVYDNHEVLMLHGQRCCFHLKPACGRCPLLDLCPAGQFRVSAVHVDRPVSPSHGKAQQVIPHTLYDHAEHPSEPQSRRPLRDRHCPSTGDTDGQH